MLVVTRKVGESLMIGDDVKIVFLGSAGRGREMKVGIEAPRTIPVYRTEVYERIQLEKAHGSGSDEPEHIKE
jgi:carbon storage regulator